MGNNGDSLYVCEPVASARTQDDSASRTNTTCISVPSVPHAPTMVVPSGKALPLPELRLPAACMPSEATSDATSITSQSQASSEDLDKRRERSSVCIRTVRPPDPPLIAQRHLESDTTTLSVPSLHLPP